MILILMMLLCFFSSLAQNDGGESDFDLNKFMGRWYENARMDHSFERGLSHVKTFYTLEENGTVRVENTGVRPDGKTKTSVGRAKIPDMSRPTHLKVSFFLWFYSDYIILYHDPQYKYAVIGSSSPKYLWILSRNPHMEDDIKEKLTAVAEEKGYDTSQLIWVEQY